MQQYARIVALGCEVNEVAMKRADFSRSAPGRLVDVRLDHGHTVAGFVPAPLGPRLELPMETATLLSRAENLLGRLDGMTDALPDPAILVRAFIRREAALSSYIEDTFAAYEEIGIVERNRQTPERSPQAREVFNAERVIQFAIEAIAHKKRSVSISLLREMHDLLLSDVDTDAQVVGDLRQKQVFIGRRALGHDEARFVPPPALFVPELVRDFCAFFSSNREYPPLLASALTHYQFETIHPFEDGNGRLGRALIIVKLCHDGCLRRPVLNPSLYFEQHRAEYYDHLLSVSQRAEWMPWIDFFLRGMIFAAEDAIERIHAIHSLLQQYRHTVQRARTSSLLLRLLEQLFIYPRITISMAAEIMGITKEAARKHVERLTNAGILEEVTGMTTHRIFVAPRILEAVQVLPTRNGNRR